MTYTTLKTTAAALALTAGTAFAGGDYKSDAKSDIDASTAIPGVQEAQITEPKEDSMSDGAPTPAVTAETDLDDDDMPLPQNFDNMTVADLVGLEVEDMRGEDVGEIDYIVEENGALVAIVGVGGVLGLGEHDVAVPLADLKFSEEDEVTLSSWSEEQLKAQPDVDEDNIQALDDDVRIAEFS